MVIVDEADEILKFINAKTMKQLFVSSSLPAPRYSQCSLCPDSCSQCILRRGNIRDCFVTEKIHGFLTMLLLVAK